MSRYKILFKISPFQEFDDGSLVTYRDENMLEYIKEGLFSKTNFFYITHYDRITDQCVISNGIDTIHSTTDQLVEIAAFLEKIQNYNQKYSGNIIENMVQWQDEIDSKKMYILEDQKMAIMLEESIISQSYFSIVPKFIDIDGRKKTYEVIRFFEDKISDLF